MGIVELVIFLVILYILYLGFVKGYFWIIALSFLGFFGGKIFILKNWPQTKSTFAVILGEDISWAAFSSFLIVFLGMAYLSNRE